jgi:hypothetical protein
MLEERSEYDPSPFVRRAADSTSLRLTVRAADRAAESWIEPPEIPFAHAFISTIDGNGGQVLFLSRSLPSGDFRTLDLLFNDWQGLKDCFGFQADEAMLDEMIEGFEPIEFVEIGLERARAEVSRARHIALEARRRLPPAFPLYEGWLLGDQAHPPDESPLPPIDPSEEEELLAACGQLLDLDEFEAWFFNPDEVDRFVRGYRRFLREPLLDDRIAELKSLLSEAVSTLIDEGQADLLAGRLRRQGWLLAQLYEDDCVTQWALAAARALERRIVADHPLLLLMMERSLLNAMDAEPWPP